MAHGVAQVIRAGPIGSRKRKRSVTERDDVEPTAYWRRSTEWDNHVIHPFQVHPLDTNTCHCSTDQSSWYASRRWPTGVQHSLQNRPTVEEDEGRVLHVPIRFFSGPLNQVISARGLAWTRHWMTIASPRGAYWIDSPWNVTGARIFICNVFRIGCPRASVPKHSQVPNEESVFASFNSPDYLDHRWSSCECVIEVHWFVVRRSR